MKTFGCSPLRITGTSSTILRSKAEKQLWLEG